MAFREALRTGAEALLGVIYPEVCCVCGKRPAGPLEHYVCRRCTAGIQFVKSPFCELCGRPFPGTSSVSFECFNCKGVELWYESARSVVLAQDGMLQAIHLFKYNRAMWLEPFLARLFVEGAAPALVDFGADLVMPVPLYPAKERERGFNQSERLAAALGDALAVRLDRKVLRRRTPTPTQTHLDRPQRQANVKDAFVADPIPVIDRRIVLVDDVFTTGATTNECARVLMRAGAKAVRVWTLARATDRPALQAGLSSDQV